MVTDIEVKTGYKQTDIGIIPNEWKLKKMGEIGYVYGGLTGKNKSDFLNGDYPYIPFLNIMNNPTIDTKFFDYVNIKFNEKQNKAQKGDLFFNGSSETPEEVGMCSILLYDIPNLYLNSFCFGFRLNDELGTDGVFLSYFFRSDIGRKLIYFLAQGATRYNLSKRDFMQLEIPYPKPVEQSNIAKTLIDVDTFITKLDKLIEKKRDIKQGTMQELLTGKRRLPGFSGEWETNRLGDLLNLEKGKQLSRRYLTETGDYPVWNGGIEPSGYTTNWNSEKNSITISEGGNSCGYVNYCGERFWRGGHCYLVKTSPEVLGYRFLYHLLKYNEPSIMSLRVGSGLPNIQKKELDNFEISYPTDKHEQEEINIAISNMENELKLLENVKNKYLDVKQGMMQQLLTGRIRLV